LIAALFLGGLCFATASAESLIRLGFGIINVPHAQALEETYATFFIGGS
jgi:hypothetical protein